MTLLRVMQVKGFNGSWGLLMDEELSLAMGGKKKKKEKERRPVLEKKDRVLG